MFQRYYTEAGRDPYDGIEWVERTGEIRNADGSILRSCAITVPAGWDQISIDMLADKYIRRAGVPSRVSFVAEEYIPMFLWRAIPAPDEGEPVTFGAETDARQVFRRLAGCWTYHGWKQGYFGPVWETEWTKVIDEDEETELMRPGRVACKSTEAIAQAFYDEILYMLAHRAAAPNSPQWFNTGLHWAYGIEGQESGQWRVIKGTKPLMDDEEFAGAVGEPIPCKDSYTYPQTSACFINSVKDTLLGDLGIMSMWERESRIFKFGGGSGGDYSALRAEGEPLSGGGFSSGLMSWLRTGDVNAGSIKSGGTTRRAARMVIVSCDHPDVETFVDWKEREEQKVAMLITGYTVMQRHLELIVAAFRTNKGKDDAWKKACRVARKAGVPDQWLKKIVLSLQQGIEPDLVEMTNDWQGDAYRTVSGQNANNSIRISDQFMRAVEYDEEYRLVWRTDPLQGRTIPARSLFERITRAAWSSGDPGLWFEDAVNDWNTCLNDGRIKACNPCAEYNFLDNTPCNLASLNLVFFYDAAQQEFDVRGYKHAVTIWQTILDITIDMSSYPDKEIALGSHRYRTTGLGYANLGSLLMRMGIAYDSVQGRAWCGALTALMHFKALETSAELAQDLGTFPRYEDNKEHVQRVVQNHCAAALSDVFFKDLQHLPGWMLVDHLCEIPNYLVKHVEEAGDLALAAVRNHGLRNAQLTLLAPTGTIGLLMGVDTTGCEPDFQLVKWKKLAGGGFIKIVNQGLPAALRHLGYNPAQIDEVERYTLGTGKALDAPHNFAMRLAQFCEIPEGKDDFANTMDCRLILGPKAVQALGYTDAEWRDINRHVCGAMTVEGAPHVLESHYPVFCCAQKCGEGTQFLPASAHLLMMAAAQPFLSGAISKTVNLPESATKQQVHELMMDAWALRLKDVAIYRDKSKMSQVLSGTPPWGSDEDDEGQGVVGVAMRLAATMRRRPLAGRRKGYTQKFRIGGQKIYLRTGEYEDGTLGEIFLDIHKQGTTLGALANCLAIAISLGLQYGVPLDEYVDAFLFTRFEPHGPVSGHDEIRNGTSVMDVIARDLAITYLGRDELAHVKAPEVRAYERAQIVPVGDRISDDHLRDTSDERQLLDTSDEEQLNGSVRPGYDGDPCANCGHHTVLSRGKCKTCDTCGANSGCS